MDEEDSQDELINRNASHGKGKRPATSILSEEENSEDGEDSQAGATDSEDGEEDDDDSLDGEEEEDEEDSGHEDAEKDLEGAVGGTSTDVAGLSSDEDAERCPICLNSFHEQPVATPESCEHYFCLDCILEWAKNANSCPVDRIVFGNILLRQCYGGKVQKTITVQKTVKAVQEEQIDLDLEQTNCEVCGGSDREDRLLLCDGCDAGYHMECLTPPLDAVPVEEWFCPECAANNRNTRSEQLSEDETSVFPTTSHSQPSNSRPTRAIARTQHSERVRANVNRHRITQARTAAQIAPRYLMQSTWLDETINAVVAGLNTAVYVRDLTPRARSRRRHKTVKRRKPKKEGKAVEGKTSSTKVRRRKRKARRTKSRRKLVVKKNTTTRSRIARSLGIKKPVRSSSVPSVYRPSEQTLGSMRADIGAASLSIYGDPFDLDPFDNEEEEMQQESAPSSLLEAKQRGLSRSAMRSHQPVARPISAGLPRRGNSIPQVQEVAEAAPVPDLLGSILSGQSMLLMDSSDVVINRDGSLKAIKPLKLSLPRRTTSGGSTSGETVSTPSTGSSLFQSNRQPTFSSSSSSSSSTLNRQSSSHSLPHPCPSPVTPVSPSPPTSHMPSSIIGHPRLHTPLPHRSMPSHPAGTERSQGLTCGVRGHPPTTVISGTSDSRHGDRGTPPQQPPAKKPTPKPVWVDVSGLPRIPKIKRESCSAVHSSSRSNSNNTPESSMTSLAGDRGRQHTIDQKGTSASRQSRTVERQRLDRTGPSSSFSNSFSATSSSASLTSNPRPSSSSAISFRISASGNPWHTRRLSGPESALLPKDKETAKRAQKDKQMLLSSLSQSKKASTKNEVYDPFNPTGSDSSESEAENDPSEMGAQRTTMEQNEGAEHLIKTEPMDLDPPMEETSSAMCVQVKTEPTSVKDESLLLPSRQSAPEHTQMQSGSLAAVMAYSESPVASDAERSETPESPFTKSLDRSRSSSTSSHYSYTKVKIEVKSEPEDELSLVKSESEDPKGNGLYDEVPSLASSSDVSCKSKDKEMSPCPQLKKERRQSESASQNPSSKEFEYTHKKKKLLPSEERRDSHSRSPGHRQSRSKSKEKTRSRSGSKERRHSRSRSKERRHSRSRSKERRHSHSRSQERTHSRSQSKERHSCSRSKERRHSRSVSKEKGRSRSRSIERRHSRSTSKGKRRSRSKSKEKRRSRSISKEGRRSRSRSKERRRSRSRSKERRRSRSRSKERRRSRSRSKERKRSRSRSKERRRSRSRSKERRRSRSRSKERRRSRSRSKERRRSRSRSKERRRSRSRSKERRRSRSRSQERRRSRSRSKERRRSRSRSKERRRSRSRSQERRRSRSRSQERRRSRSRSKDRRQSFLRSKDRRRSRSRSKERRHSRSQDRRRLTRSSSLESSKKRKTKLEGREQYDGRGKDGHKKLKEKKRSHSRSRSRSKERRRQQPSSHRSSSVSRDGGEARLKRKRSRSASRERKQRDVLEGSRQKERSTNKSTASISVKAKEQNHSSNKNVLVLKEEPESRTKECEAKISFVSIKETEPSMDSVLTEGLKEPEEIKMETYLFSMADKPHDNTPKEIKQENTWSLGEVKDTQLQKYIKREEEESYCLCEGLKKPEEIKKEEITTLSVIQKSESEEFNHIFPKTPESQTSSQDEKSTSNILELPKSVKIEQIWPDDEYGDDDGDDSYSESALIINLCPPDPDPMDCEKEPEGESESLSVVTKEETEVECYQAACTVKQEPLDSSDEDINVDYLIDNLDFIKKEMKDSPVTDPAGAVEPQPVTQEVSAGAKQEIESALVMTSTKTKSQGKRVTWNIQEPEGPQPEKMSKLALFKLKLKQEGSRKTALTFSSQSPGQEAAPIQVGSKLAATNINPSAQEGQSELFEGGSKSCREELLQDIHQKDKYMKKLHMQERAIEEVKLAIKPFYQKRDITKEEYKEILRKAVQKVCHSKSGEINPVKVANLVKAYVDKYKHARKHRKDGNSGPSQSAEGLKDSETPG